MDKAAIENAKEYFGQIVEEQLNRIEEIKKAADWIDYAQIKPIIIGIIGGDGIGPYIAKEARRVLEFMLKNEMDTFTNQSKIDANRVILASSVIFVFLTVIPFLIEKFISADEFMNIRYYIGVVGVAVVVIDRIYVSKIRKK